MTRLTGDPTVSSTGSTKIPATTSLSCLFTWLGTRGDYDSIGRRDRALKGWRRKISPVTYEGRFNIVIATWITTAVVGIYTWKWYTSSKKNTSVDNTASK